MVKADVKRDYYADLDLPANADTEEIKRQFRLLAKQYHPDRNPGHEVEVVPKFQAVQAAHEILIDPVEKSKYDAGRARLAAKNAATLDPYGFAKPATTRPTPPARSPFAFPPPPKTPQRPGYGASQKPQASAGAEKFNAFTRGPPQSWDRTRFDEARADAAKPFTNMRPTSAQPPPPPRPTARAPTAPKPSPNAEMPHIPNVPLTSFPGLSRTASSRRPDYQPDTTQMPRSAFSYVSGTRGQQQPTPHINVQDSYSPRSPPVSRARPSVSPLRHTRSSDYDMRQELHSRPSARYAGAGGERTDLHSDNLHRSSSVRNSPIDERGPFGRPPARFENLPRHRSASPGIRKQEASAEFSESTSSDDEPLHMNSRPKVAPRSRPSVRSNISYETRNPGLTSQFPSTNYTRVADASRYNYPPPDAKEPVRRPFPDTMSPGSAHTGGVPLGGNKKYGPFSSEPLNCGNRKGFSFNGFPSWSVPSSVFPQTTPPRPKKSKSEGFVIAWDNLANRTASNVPSSTFSAEDWHEKLSSDNLFRVDESHLRKSPSKTSRSNSKPTLRARAATSEAEPDKAAAFQPGKLGSDWAARASAKPTHSPDSADSRDRYVVVEEDVMDVDTPPTNGTTNGLKHTATSEALPQEAKRRSSHGGVDLNEFTQHAPFAPTAGLSGLKDDLETHLPFESRAADLNVSSTAARIRALKLPHPPKCIIPPAGDLLDTKNFTQYVENMQAYMRDWNAFNAKMIEHFRSRQDRVCGTMSSNWVGQLGDGPAAEILDHEGGDSKQAGYGAYMQWLKDDAQCRDWWEEANEKHLRCLEDLGRTRETARKRLLP